MASLDTCEPSIDAARNGTSAEAAAAPMLLQPRLHRATHQRDGHAGHERRANERRERRQPFVGDVSDPDVDACLRVLDNIVKDPKAFGMPQHRKLKVRCARPTGP